MTRIAFVGNSHLEAYRDALPYLSHRYPHASFYFFGVQNPVFFQTDKLGGTALRLAQPLDDAPNQMTSPDGAHALDLGNFDLVVLASHSFFLRKLVDGLAQVDVVGYRVTNPDLPMVSMACIEDMISLRIRHYIKRITQFFGPLQNAVVLQAPLPVTEITTLDPAYKRLHDHPARDAIFATFQKALHQTGWRRDVPVLLVPDAVLEVPFFTKNTLGRHRTQAETTPLNRSDCLHMNRHYVEQSLPFILDGLLPDADATTSKASG